MWQFITEYWAGWLCALIGGAILAAIPKIKALWDAVLALLHDRTVPINLRLCKVLIGAQEAQWIWEEERWQALEQLYRVLPFYGAGVHHPRRPAQPELPLQDLSCDGRQRHRHGIVQESLRFTHPRLKKGTDIMNAHIPENNTPAIPAATIARTVVLALALVNQLLSAAGKPVLPIDSASVEQWVTAGLTTAATIWAWWENNSFTPEAIRADELLDQMQGKIK